jgi:hypothetical protein
MKLPEAPRREADAAPPGNRYPPVPPAPPVPPLKK